MRTRSAAISIRGNCPPILIGKESDRHWEEGEDLSLLDFKAIEYKSKGLSDRNQRTIRENRQGSQAGIHAEGN